MDPYNDPSGYGALIAFLAVFGFVFFVFAVAAYVVSSIFYAKLFEKAGVEGKWRGWVPVYRELVFVKLGDLNPWWLLALLGASFVLNLIPYLGPLLGWIPSVAAAVYLALAAYRIQLKLQKDGVWVVLYVLLSIVWLGIMAFDKSRWNTAVAPAPWARNFLADTTVWSGIPAQASAGGYAAPAAPGYPAPGAYPPPAPAYGAPAAPPAPAYDAPTPPPAAAQPPVPPTEPPAPPVPPTEPPAAPPAPPTEPPSAPEPPKS